MTVLITGSSRGIGKELVIYFSKFHPDYKIIALSRDEDKLIELSQSINNDNLYIIPYDINNIFIDSKSLVMKIEAITNKIDILINNAGMLKNKGFSEFNYKEAQNIFNANFFAPSFLIKELLVFLKKSSNSHIVNIGSMGGYQGSSKFAGLSYYSASKAALANITECLAEEFRNINVKVNCLALGAVQTEMLAEAFPNYTAPINAENMAQFISDFSINAHQFMNGKILPISLSTP